MNKSSALGDWTPEQIAIARRWVETWKLAAIDLERIRRKRIRELDNYKAISLLCGTADLYQTSVCAKAMVGSDRTTAIVHEAAGREPNYSGLTDPDG